MGLMRSREYPACSLATQWAMRIPFDTEIREWKVWRRGSGYGTPNFVSKRQRSFVAVPSTRTACFKKHQGCICCVDWLTIRIIQLAQISNTTIGCIFVSALECKDSILQIFLILENVGYSLQRPEWICGPLLVPRSNTNHPRTWTNTEITFFSFTQIYPLPRGFILLGHFTIARRLRKSQKAFIDDSRRRKAHSLNLPKRQ